MVWNVAVPLLLLTPVALSPAAAPHRAAVYAVFLVFFATFGGCIPVIQDARSGWTEKLLLTGYGARRWVLERTAVSAVLDMLQLLPALAVLTLVAGPGVGAILALLAALALAVTVGNLVGGLIAAAVRSLAEGALACAAVSLLALHFAGTFRTPPNGSWAARIEAWSPYRPLHETLVRLDLSEGSIPWPSLGWPPMATAVLLLVAVLLLAPRLATRFSWPRN